MANERRQEWAQTDHQIFVTGHTHGEVLEDDGGIMHYTCRRCRRQIGGMKAAATTSTARRWLRSFSMKRMVPPTSSFQRARTGPPSASTSRTGRGGLTHKQLGTPTDSAPATGALLSHSAGQDHETLLRTDQEPARKAGLAAMPTRVIKTGATGPWRDRAFSQTVRRPQALRGFDPTLTLWRSQAVSSMLPETGLCRRFRRVSKVKAR